MPETPSQSQPRPKDGERVSKLEDAWALALRRIPTPYCLQADKSPCRGTVPGGRRRSLTA